MLILDLSFKGATHLYLLKVSVTHNKNRILLLNLLINDISAISAPQILTLKDEGTFLITALSNYLANSSFDIISLLTAPLANLFRVAINL